MKPLQDAHDAYGHLLFDYFDHRGGCEIVERDDGLVEATAGPKAYFTEYEEWPEWQKAAMRYASGRVLDIGCGAGRHALHLQGQGLEAVGIDNSPLAIKVCKLRGLREARVVSITQISSRLGEFDTVLMMGNNFGLFGSPGRAKWLLGRLRTITSRRARIIAESTDPYRTDAPEHLTYHERNRERGRMSGHLRIRIRYKKYATPWFDYLLASKGEAKRMVEDSGWDIGAFVDGESGKYIAIIERAGIRCRVVSSKPESRERRR